MFNDLLIANSYEQQQGNFNLEGVYFQQVSTATKQIIESIAKVMM